MPFYQLSQDQKTVRLPYQFGALLTGTRPNLKASHVKVINNQQPPFVATLRPHQVPVATEALQQLITYYSTTLGVYPGFGKTILGIALAYAMGYCTVILCHRDTIARQWLKTIETCVPAYLPYTWMVGESEMPTTYLPPFIICMDGRYEQIPEVIRAAVGTMIVDEAHLFCTKSRAPEPFDLKTESKSGCLLYFEPRYIIIESATLPRPDGMHSMIHALAGEHGVFRISTEPYTVILIETGIKVPEEKGSRGTRFDKLCLALSQSPERTAIILDLLVSNLNHKSIVLSRSAPYVEVLEYYLGLYKVTCDTLYRSKSSYSDSQVLIGTSDKIGVGFDEANACEDYKGIPSDTLYLVHSYKNPFSFEQYRGRVMRGKRPTIVCFLDRNKISGRHFDELMPWIKYTNGQVVQVPYRAGLKLASLYKV